MGGMPEPIQSSPGPNQSYYDPSDEVSRAPATALAATSSAGASPPGNTTPPDGKDMLLKKYGSGGEDCTKHLINAGIGLAVAGAGATGAIVLAPMGVGSVVGMVGIVGGIARTATALADYGNCEDQNQSMREAAAECNAQGGTLLGGAGDSDAVCVRLEK